MVFRVYVEKKPGLDNEARALLGDARSLLGIESLEQVRLYNRYDVEGLSADLFEYAKNTVFADWYQTAKQNKFEQLPNIFRRIYRAAR